MITGAVTIGGGVWTNGGGGGGVEVTEGGADGGKLFSITVVGYCIVRNRASGFHRDFRGPWLRHEFKLQSLHLFRSVGPAQL